MARRGRPPRVRRTDRSVRSLLSLASPRLACSLPARPAPSSASTTGHQHLSIPLCNRVCAPSPTRPSALLTSARPSVPALLSGLARSLLAPTSGNSAPRDPASARRVTAAARLPAHRHTLATGLAPPALERRSDRSFPGTCAACCPTCGSASLLTPLPSRFQCSKRSRFQVEGCAFRWTGEEQHTSELAFAASRSNGRRSLWSCRK